MRTLAIFFLLAFPVAAQTTRITSGDNFVVPTVIVDASGSGNNGTNVGSVTSVVGTNGRALQFNGSSQYVQVSNPGLFTFPNTNFSVAFWMNSSSTNAQVPVSNDGSTNGWGFFMASGNTAQMYFKRNQADAAVVNATANVQNGVWHHVVGVATTSTNAASLNQMTLYIDGAQVGSLTTNQVYAVPSVPLLSLGRRPSGNFYSGSLDDIRIYNRALSSNEVVSVYSGSAPTNGLVAYYPLDDGAYQTGLVGYWPLEDNGSTTPDRSGNGNTGTLTASPTTVAGKFGSALQFNGTSQYGRTANANLNGATEMSVSCWVRCTGTISATQILLEKTTNYNNFSSGFVLARAIVGSVTNALTFSVRGLSGSVYADAPSSTAINDGQWHHVLGTWTSAVTTNQSNIYVDGAHATNLTRPINNNVTTTRGTGDVYIGSRGGASLFLNGSLDDIRIYNRALSAAEISSMYNSRRTYYGGQ